MDLRRIDNNRFTIRFVHICKSLNIKTVHSAKKYFTENTLGQKVKNFTITQKVINEIQNI